MKVVLFTLVLMMMTVQGSLHAQDWRKAPDQPEELGDVRWMRDYEAAMARAQERDVPVFILFQEVPGCSTCRNYGNNILRHPLVVEAIEEYFVPLAIYNNKGGADAKVLSMYGEPSWNNPVVRIVDPKDSKDIVPRLAGRYDLQHMVANLSRALLASGRLIPNYLDLLAEEVSVTNPRETYLSMYCFWSGELALAAVDGVLETEAGFMHGREVVRVIYDAAQVSEEDLLSAAQSQKCADAVYTDDGLMKRAATLRDITHRSTGRFRADKESKYYLHRSAYSHVPMTSLQALKVNRAIANKQDFAEYLSPRQIALLQDQTLPHSIGKDLVAAWSSDVLK